MIGTIFALKACCRAGGLEFVLAEKGEFAAVFKAEEIGQAILAYAFGTGRTQEDPVDTSEMCGVIPEYGTGQDVPLAAVGAGTVQAGHFGRTDNGACSEPSWHDDGGIGVRGAEFATCFDGLA
jgi:hypothetical protein